MRVIRSAKTVVACRDAVLVVVQSERFAYAQIAMR